MIYILFIKGIIIGIAKVLPGVSGSVLAIRLNVYERMIEALNYIYKKDSIKFLIPLSLGILVSIVIFSKVLYFLIANYYYIFKWIFIILICLGIPDIVKKTNKYSISIIVFLIYIIFFNLTHIDLSFNYFVLGIIESISIIIPGISGSAIYMSLGVYDEILYMFSNLYVIISFKFIHYMLGVIITSLLLIKIVNYCLKKYNNESYGVILGLLLGSIILLIIK